MNAITAMEVKVLLCLSQAMTFTSKAAIAFIGPRFEGLVDVQLTTFTPMSSVHR
jgi:hypothetical protein